MKKMFFGGSETEKTRYYQIKKNIRGGNCLDSLWHGGYLIETYEYNGKTYEVMDDMDNGISYSITQLD